MDGSVRIFAKSDRKWELVDPLLDKVLYVLADHSRFVQGIAWDPLSQFLASQSNDRSVFVYRLEQMKSAPKILAKHSRIVQEEV
jgi:WD40 repeat protein